jgi:IS605 OrfB family transposase
MISQGQGKLLRRSDRAASEVGDDVAKHSGRVSSPLSASNPTTDAAKVARAKAAAAVKAQRKLAAGLSRTIKLRLYPLPDQAKHINGSIGAVRHVWNAIWLPMLQTAEQARRDHAKASGETPEAWKAAWRLHKDPTETQYNRARIAAQKPGAGREWIGEALQSPFSRAARSFVDAVKASRGQTRNGTKRKRRLGRAKPRARRDDCRQGLEWQLQGGAPLGGRPLANVIAAGVVNVPVLGAVKFQDKGRQLRAYMAAGVEACELTVKRDGEHYYACIAVRGLLRTAAHVAQCVAIGIDMGVANPLATSDGELITHHQGHNIRVRLSRLERRKLRCKRQYARRLRQAAKRAGALTATSGIRRGVKIENSNRMHRCVARQNKIDRQIVGYRADWQRKCALEIARSSEIVVVEALSIKNMTASAAGTAAAPGRNVRAKAGLNRAILARGWGTMRQRLKTKAEEFGGQLIEVDPAYTSQTCPGCGHVSRDNRKTQARFECSCGFQGHADIVGATNTLARGLSAGAPPAAGRRGLATGAVPLGMDAERADEASNKPSCEPQVSLKDAGGSRGAKSHERTNCNTERHYPTATTALVSRGSRNGQN